MESLTVTLSRAAGLEPVRKPNVRELFVCNYLSRSFESSASSMPHSAEVELLQLLFKLLALNPLNRNDHLD